MSRFVVVLGYRYELAEETLRTYKTGYDVALHRDFADTPTIHSLGPTRDVLDDVFLYANADAGLNRWVVRLPLGRPPGALAVEIDAPTDDVRVQALESSPFFQSWP